VLICLMQVTVPDETRYSVFIPQSVEYDHSRILQLLSVTCGRDDSVCSDTSDSLPDESTSSHFANQSTDLSGGTGYLVLVRGGKSSDGGDDGVVVWDGREVKIDLTGDTAIAISHIQVMLLN